MSMTIKKAKPSSIIKISSLGKNLLAISRTIGRQMKETQRKFESKKKRKLLKWTLKRS